MTHASDGVEPDRLAEEQTALRRVATLVAQGAEPSRLFAVVAEQVAHVLGVPFASVVRFEDEGTVVQRASYAERGVVFPSDKRWLLEGTSALAQVHAHGKPARLEDYSGTEGEIAEFVRRVGIRSTVAVPIVVAGRVSGAMVVSATESALPADTEVRLTAFTELLATAIANSESQEEVTRLAEEQAALRRVATLVAHDVAPDELFRAVAGEVGRLLGTDLAGISRYDPDDVVTHFSAWSATGEAPDVAGRVSRDSPGLSKTIRDTGRPARVDEWHEIPAVVTGADPLKVRCAVGSPIVVENRVWGKLVVASTQSQLAPDTESRLMAFTELLGTAIANADARGQVQRLAEEQAALRRVATLVAEDVASRELFDAVACEVGVLLGADLGGMIRYEDDGTVTAVAKWAAVGEHPPMPERWQIEPGDPAWMILENRAATRVEDWTSVPGPFAEAVRNRFGVSSSVGCPIVVEGRLWGALAIHSKQSRPLPPDTESRIAQFTDLVGTAIANAESRERADRLGEEQTALRRVATLVAQEAPLETVFAKVAEEVVRTVGDVDSALWRDDGDRTVTAIAVRGPGVAPRVRVGTRLTLDGESVIARVLREGRPHRIDDFSQIAGSVAERARELGMRSGVGCPIVVGSRTWGVMTVATYEAEPFASETETRLARFSDLVATAIANAETRAEVERLAAEQAALRRVATLVAVGSSPSAVLDAVAAEMERALGADAAMLFRYEPDEEVTVVAGRVPDPRALPVGTRVSHQGENVTSMVRRTGRPARIGDYRRAGGPIADLARAVERDVRSAVGAPIVVDGRLWGVIIASWGEERSPPDDIEERMAKFARLLDTAIANADGRDQLIASRARLLTAGDEARRRVVRDLHDGAQQRLVHAIVTLKLARQAFRDDDGKAESLVGEALDHAQQGNRELRELAHGILPRVLTHGGLRAGVEAVVERLDLPVEVDVPAERLPAEIEASAYFIVAEALTNVVKHSHAGRAEVTASLEDGTLRIAVRDDGAGGADPDGHGLLGMRDRVTTLGGRLDIESPAGGGTLVAATLPLAAG